MTLTLALMGKLSTAWTAVSSPSTVTQERSPRDCHWTTRLREDTTSWSRSASLLITPGTSHPHTHQACDKGPEANCSTASVTVHVTDFNDEFPTFDFSSYRTEICLSQAVGEVFLQPVATDRDSGNNSLLTYSLHDVRTVSFILAMTPNSLYDHIFSTDKWPDDCPTREWENLTTEEIGPCRGWIRVHGSDHSQRWGKPNAFWHCGSDCPNSQLHSRYLQVLAVRVGSSSLSMPAAGSTSHSLRLTHKRD